MWPIRTYLRLGERSLGVGEEGRAVGREEAEGWVNEREFATVLKKFADRK